MATDLRVTNNYLSQLVTQVYYESAYEHNNKHPAEAHF